MSEERRGGLFTWTTLLGLVAGVVIAGWLIGRVANDRWWWSQWLWWVPTQIAILAAIFGAVASVRLKLRRNVFGVVLLVMTAWFVGVEQRLLHTDDELRRGLRVLHWNAPWWTGIDADRLVDPIFETDADITVISSYNRLHLNERIREWLGEARPYRLPPFTVLTRYPIRGGAVVHTNDDAVELAVLRLDTGEGEILMLLVDLPSDPMRSRADIATLVIESLERQGIPKPDIVIGDFNMTRGSHSIARMFPEHDHAFDIAGHGYAGTFHRGAGLLHHIDHALIADTLTARRYDIIDAGVGRHAMQIVDVTWNSSR